MTQDPPPRPPAGVVGEDLFCLALAFTAASPSVSHDVQIATSSHARDALTNVDLNAAMSEVVATDPEAEGTDEAVMWGLLLQPHHLVTLLLLLS